MTSKERAALKKQAMQLDSIYQIGKSSLTPQMVDAIRGALKARELIKVHVLKNCLDDPREIAAVLSERTGSELVQVIGKKIILYKKNVELEEKRKRAAKRKTKLAKSSAGRESTTEKKAKDSVKRSSGKRKGTARPGNAEERMAKGAARRSSGTKAMTKGTARRSSGTAGTAKSAGFRGRYSTGKPMKWSDR